MKIRIEITEHELKELVMEKIQTILGDFPFDKNCLVIQVKSKQNYKSEWEPATFRAVYQ